MKPFVYSHHLSVPFSALVAGPKKSPPAKSHKAQVTDPLPSVIALIFGGASWYHCIRVVGRREVLPVYEAKPCKSLFIIEISHCRVAFSEPYFL